MFRLHCAIAEYGSAKQQRRKANAIAMAELTYSRYAVLTVSAAPRRMLISGRYTMRSRVRASGEALSSTTIGVDGGRN